MENKFNKGVLSKSSSSVFENLIVFEDFAFWLIANFLHLINCVWFEPELEKARYLTFSK